VKSEIRDPKSEIPDGVLVVDKTEGPTSHDVVTFARRALGVSRIGHTGTLDPMATGVLPLVIGRATRLAQFLTASDKTYEATVAFGRMTDTYDASGKVTGTSDRRPAREDLESALTRFRGTFEQTPPAYSAKNIDGERSYDLARRGKTAVAQRPKAVPVTVKRLEVIAFDGETARLEMQVTAGFYVLGFLQDTWDSIAATIDYSIDLGSTFAQFKILTPYPGTPMFKQLEPLLTETDWEKYDGYSPTFAHPNMTAFELRYLLGTAYKRYYMRPSYLANFLKIQNGAIREWVGRMDQRVKEHHSREEIADVARSVAC
jgi:tRNA pseudouridine(55) synthase